MKIQLSESHTRYLNDETKEVCVCASYVEFGGDGAEVEVVRQDPMLLSCDKWTT